MRTLRATIPVALCLLLGCKNGNAVPATSASSTLPGDAAPSTSAPAAKPALTLRATRAPKGYDLDVVNESDGAIEIDDLVMAERHDATSWEPAGHALSVVERCGLPSGKPPCVTLAKGATLRLPTWDGMTCDPRCPCKANAVVKPGEYRFVARRCGGDVRFESAPFAWP